MFVETVEIPKNAELSKMKDLKYRLDKSVFQAMSFEEASKQINNSANWEDHINHFNYLMSVAYSFLGEQWPQMDRKVFKKIKQS